ncbi:MAG: GDP-mannose 4,6-dehydratase [Chloroflexi bacterium]|nr:GDP-mannose 4,6-dehydratase [Chloroflexota bacterium]
MEGQREGRALAGRTLITGGAGFIGSRLAARLLAERQPVILLDNFNDYYDPARKRANIADLRAEFPDRPPLVVEADVRDRSALSQLFVAEEIRRVAHLAGMAAVRYSVERAPLYAEVNTLGSVNVLECARQHEVENFILASTSSVYGNAAPPFREDQIPDRPLAPYPASKRAAELMAHATHALFGLNVTIARLFNVYGPAGRPDMMPLKVLDWLHEGRVIPMYDGGALRRDWTYIDDTVEALFRALQQPLGYEILNLGFGATRSFAEFVAIYEELTGIVARKEHLPAPPSEPDTLWSDPTKARRLLGWQPKTDLQTGLQATWDWYRGAVLSR